MKSLKQAVLLSLVALTSCVHAQTHEKIGGTGGVGGLASYQGNATPRLQITTLNLQNGTIGVPYSDVIQTQYGVGTLAFTVLSGSLPSGLTLNPTTGAITGTPNNNAAIYNFVVQVTDSSGPPQVATQPETISILCPVLQITNPLILPAGIQGTNYQQQMLATGGIAPLAWSSTGLPAGESIDATTGLISGTPSVSGAFNPTITVHDSCPLSIQTAKGIFSQQVNSNLAILTQSLASGIVNQIYSQTLSAGGGTLPYSWSISSGSLPTGLTLSPTTGVISGTVTIPGSFTFTVQVTDASLNSVTAPFTISIACAPIAISTPQTLPNATQGQSYQQQFAASGGFGGKVWTASGLPFGLSMSSGGNLTGTPTTNGTFTFTVTVMDSCPTAPQSQTLPFTLTININTGTLAITTTSLPAATVGVTYGSQMAAKGGTPPYTWSLNGGGFVTGTSMNGAGLISGTPTQAQTTSPDIKVTDSLAATIHTVFSMVSSCVPITFVTTSPLASATTGLTYSNQIQVTGGNGSITFGASGLPTGLSISSSGLISGVPSVSGTFTPTITATDSCSPTPQAKPQQFTLNVAQQLAITNNSPLTNGIVETPYTNVFNAVGGAAPYTWNVTSGTLLLPLTTNGTLTGNVEDMMDWWMMDSRRQTQHATGGPNPAFSYIDSDGVKFWRIKGNAGNPWDIKTYGTQGANNASTCADDANGNPRICFWITENTAAGFSNAKAYKRQVTPIPVSPRFFVDGTTVTYTIPGPNNSFRTGNCELDAPPLTPLGQIQGTTTGPTPVAWGGDVGTVNTIVVTWQYQLTAGVYQQRERFNLVKGWGVVSWDHATWNGSVYLVDNTTTNNVLTTGGIVPNFPCFGTTPNWIGGAPGAGGNAIGPNTSTPAVTSTGTVQVTDSLAATSSKSFTLAFNPIPVQGGGDNRYCLPNETINSSALPQDADGNGNLGPAQPLQKCVRTSMADTPASGPIKTVCASGCDFTTITAASTAAQPGWIIQIKATTNNIQNVYTSAVISTSGTASNWIIYETDQMSSIPAEGNRISPAFVGVPSMHIACPAGSGGGGVATECGRPPYSQPQVAGTYLPKIRGGNNTIAVNPNVHHVRFIGLEVTTTSGTNTSATIQQLGPNDHIIYDRIYNHGGDAANGQDKLDHTRGWFWSGCTYCAVIDSYVIDYHCRTGGTCGDSQAILLGGNASVPEGPWKVTDDFLEAASEPVFSGGGGTGASNTVPHDLEYRRNHSEHPLFWKPNDPSYFGQSFQIKNLFELKTLDRVLIEGSIFEQTWEGQADQHGHGVLLAAKNQSSVFSGTGTSNGAGTITKVSGSINFNANQVSTNCATPGHCIFKYNGIGYPVNSVVDATHLVVGPNAQSGLLPPTSTSALSYTACQPGQNLNAQVTNVTMRYSIIRHTKNGMQMAGALSDCGDKPAANGNFTFHDLIIDDQDGAVWISAGGARSGNQSQPLGQFSNDVAAPRNLHDISFWHITGLPRLNNGNPAGAFGPGIAFTHQGAAATSIANIKIYDSIFAAGLKRDQIGICTNGTDATSVLACVTSTTGSGPGTYCFDHNVLATTTASASPGGSTGTANNPPWPSASPNCPFTVTGNALPASYDAIQFTNLNSAIGGNYKLQVGSPYHNTASDGTDPGANIDLVNQYTAGVQ